MRMGELQTLLDRAAISDLVNAYATAVDTRDWGLFRTLFTDRVFIDMRSLDPTRYKEISAAELLDLAKPLANFDATQHLSSNHRHAIDGDQATCVAYMHASHFLKRDGGDFYCVLTGYYTYSLVRTAAGWKISKYALQVTGQHGDPRVFAWAGIF
jgi:hypothetical protein